MRDHVSLDLPEVRGKVIKQSFKEYSEILERLKTIEEQLNNVSVDLSPLTVKLDAIMAAVEVLNRGKEELTKKQTEVLGLFALALKQKVDQKESK